LDGSLQEFCRFGLVHHLLYPRCVSDADHHAETLEAFASRDDIETFDCCLPFGDARRRRLIDVIKGCGKSEIAYATHLFPLRKISLATLDPGERGLVRLAMIDQMEMAAAIGATGFVFASGCDVPESQRPRARAAFADFCRWLCAELKPRGMTALLEPCDFAFDKKFLYGPTAECVELVQSLGPQVDNFGLLVDIAHLPLMGESFEEAIRTAAPCMKRVHLGNCVRDDPASPFYGDRHPPVGIEGGEIDVPELVEVLRLLLDMGYLSKARRGALLLEMSPFPGATVEETIADNMDRLHRAWRKV